MFGTVCVPDTHGVAAPRAVLVQFPQQGREAHLILHPLGQEKNHEHLEWQYIEGICVMYAGMLVCVEIQVNTVKYSVTTRKYMYLRQPVAYPRREVKQSQ